VPYNPEQIVDIVKSKLGEETSKVVQPQALILLAKKIAASTGDMRAAMQVLSRALDKLPQNAGETSPLGMKDMLDALRRCTTSSASSTGSATSAVVRDLGLQARLVLVAILVARRRLGADLSLTFASLSSPSKGSKVVEQMTPSRLFTLYSAILTSPPSSYTQTTSSSFSPVSRNEFTDLIGVLETSSIVTLNLCSSPSRGKGRGGKNAAAESTLELAESVREEEVLKGLVSGADGKSGVKEDEIKRLWEGELWRLGNELRAKGRQAEAANPQVLGFD
jgi:cell division control protein 6